MVSLLNELFKQSLTDLSDVMTVYEIMTVEKDAPTEKISTDEEIAVIFNRIEKDVEVFDYTPNNYSPERAV